MDLWSWPSVGVVWGVVVIRRLFDSYILVSINQSSSITSSPAQRKQRCSSKLRALR
jgi:hypothetical protein